MPVYKDTERGTWFVSMRLPDEITGKSKKVVKRGFKTKKEASQWEAKQTAEKATARSDMTFWEILQKYLDNNDTSKSTRSKKEGWLKKYFPYNDSPIRKVGKSDLVAWRNDLKKKDIAARTMNSGLQYVRSVFTFYATVYNGENSGVVLKNYKVSKAEKKKFDVWSVAEFYQFIQYVDQPTLRDFFTFIFWTGCRRGEAIALTADCINGNSVHIYRSMKHGKNGFQPLKTDSSERTIRVQSELAEMLQNRIPQAEPFIFGGEWPIALTTINKYFKRAIIASGVKPIRVHDLRHSHASILLNNGVNILAVSKRLGHSSVRTTLDVYAHLLQETDDEMMEKIEEIQKNGIKVVSQKTKTA
jgi:integrase